MDPAAPPPPPPSPASGSPPALKSDPVPAAPPPPSDTTKITFTVSDASGRSVTIQARPSTLVDRVLRSFAEHHGQPPSSVRLLFEGRRLQPSETLGEVGVQNEDQIDAMIEQTGGGAS